MRAKIFKRKVMRCNNKINKRRHHTQIPKPKI